MSHSLTFRFAFVMAACTVATAILPPVAAAKKSQQQDKAKSQAAYDQALDDYVRQASAANPNTPTTLGSLWTTGGTLSNMARDDKASQVGDLITINILETTTASASGTAKGSRSFSASSGITAALGVIKPTAPIANIFSPNSQNSLDGSATTASSHSLSTNLAGSVVKVLPNGYLVIQAARDVYIDNQRQHVTVRGVIRPSDIAPDNSVPSTAVANLQVEVEGKGVITDETRPPNAITRFLLRLVSF
jgi:flagellar L-ring protein precursor FlgH